MPVPVLVLGIGNRLLGDDGVGLALLERLEREFVHDSPRVEFLDGGTQGLALLGSLDNRAGVLILDAIQLGHPPGTVHVLRPDEVSAGRQTVPSAHGSNARELLDAARLVGQLPPDVVIVGIEPSEIKTQIGLSALLEQVLPAGVEAARTALRRLLNGVGTGPD